MEDVERLINNIFHALAKKIDRIDKLKVKEYEAMLCDCIEKIKNETEEKERVKCFGGSCEITYNPISDRKKHSVRCINFEKKALEEINSEASLYFKDINEEWIKKTATITVGAEKFDMDDADTMEFITRIKAGEIIEHKIDF